ncbi:MAG: hypothetical protein KAH13_00155, partial [Tenericutes bacterium]|nr:hypothetical protein [Mycoplasmatota bacterium]
MRKLMKHALTFFVLSIVISLVACGEVSTTTSADITTTTTEDGSTTQQVTTTEENIITEEVPNMMGQDFVIMVNKAASADPRSETYTGSWKTQKIALIDVVEANYNINVVYRTYPADAVWGGGRERFIITNSLNETPQAHIYEMPSQSISVLAEGGAILPLDTLIETYGNPGYWPEKAAFGTVLGKQYAYDDSYPLA